MNRGSRFSGRSRELVRHFSQLLYVIRKAIGSGEDMHACLRTCQGACGTLARSVGLTVGPRSYGLKVLWLYGIVPPMSRSAHRSAWSGSDTLGKGGSGGRIVVGKLPCPGHIPGSRTEPSVGVV